MHNLVILDINGSCHEWKKPIVKSDVDTQMLFGGAYIWHTQLNPNQQLEPNVKPAKITR